MPSETHAPTVGTSVDENVYASEVDWTDPGNITASDNTYATAALSTLPGATYSHALVGTTYGFAIPSTAPIVGMTLTVARKCGTGNIKDWHVQMLDTILNQMGGTDQANASAWPTTEGDITYGSASDTWNWNITGSSINSEAIRPALMAQANGGSDTASVDYFEWVVYYQQDSQYSAAHISNVPIIQRQTRRTVTF